jgi:hypothetical protein
LLKVQHGHVTLNTNADGLATCFDHTSELVVPGLAILADKRPAKNIGQLHTQPAAMSAPRPTELDLFVIDRVKVAHALDPQRVQMTGDGFLERHLTMGVSLLYRTLRDRPFVGDEHALGTVDTRRRKVARRRLLPHALLFDDGEGFGAEIFPDFREYSLEFGSFVRLEWGPCVSLHTAPAQTGPEVARKRGVQQCVRY